MKGRITKDGLIREITIKTGFSREAVKTIVEVFMDQILHHLSSGATVSIQPLTIIKPKVSPGYSYYSAPLKKQVTMSKHTRFYFKYGHGLRKIQGARVVSMVDVEEPDEQ